MTYGQMRDRVLMLLNQYSIAGGKIRVTYNNQADDLTRVPGAVNEALVYLATTAKEKPVMAEVIAVGPGGNVDGKEVTMYVTVGEKVIYSKYAGTEVKLDGEEYIIVRQSDILAIVD